MSTYEPGAVAVATVRGVKGVRVWRHGGGWCAEHEYHSDQQDEVTDIRPLVVLDLEGHDVAPNLEDIREAVDEYDTRLGPGSARDLFEAIADQIEAQVKPPRIPEPGLWGVVEARTVGSMPNKWIHCEDGSWSRIDGALLGDWDDLIDPTLIREGQS